MEESAVWIDVNVIETEISDSDGNTTVQKIVIETRDFSSGSLSDQSDEPIEIPKMIETPKSKSKSKSTQTPNTSTNGKASPFPTYSFQTIDCSIINEIHQNNDDDDDDDTDTDTDTHADSNQTTTEGFNSMFVRIIRFGIYLLATVLVASVFGKMCRLPEPKDK